MSTVTVSLLDGEATPVDKLVRAQLVGSVNGTYRAVDGFTSDGILVSPVQRLTSDGTIDLELVDNADVTPSGTYWRISAGGHSWVVDVTGDGTVEELLVDTPASYTAAALAVHAALENPHHTELDDLTDVDATSPTVGRALAWSGTAWVPTDMGTQIELDAEAALARNADNLTSGTVADARIASTIARDSEVAAAVSAHEAAGDPHPGYLTAAEGNAAYQPLDSDLTAVAAANNGAVLAATTASFTTSDEAKLDGIESGATADQTAADIRGLGFFDTSNDGSGSGLDADTVDGQHASAFAASGHDHSGVYRAAATAVPAADVDFGGGIDLVEAFSALTDYATDDSFRILAPVDIPYSATNFSTNTQSNSRYLAGYLGSSGAQNAEVVYRLRGPLAAGTWSIRLVHSTNTSNGIYTIATSSDGSSWTDLTTIDGYASPAVAAVVSDATGLTIPAATSHIRLKMATKHASSSNYYGAFSALTGVRTA